MSRNDFETAVAKEAVKFLAKETLKQKEELEDLKIRMKKTKNGYVKVTHPSKKKTMYVPSGTLTPLQQSELDRFVRGRDPLEESEEPSKKKAKTGHSKSKRDLEKMMNEKMVENMEKHHFVFTTLQEFKAADYDVEKTKCFSAQDIPIKLIKEDVKANKGYLKIEPIYVLPKLSTSNGFFTYGFGNGSQYDKKKYPKISLELKESDAWVAQMKALGQRLQDELEKQSVVLQEVLQHHSKVESHEHILLRPMVRAVKQNSDAFEERVKCTASLDNYGIWKGDRRLVQNRLFNNALIGKYGWTQSCLSCIPAKLDVQCVLKIANLSTDFAELFVNMSVAGKIKEV